MKTTEIIDDKISHATPEKIKRWTRKVMAYDKKARKEFHDAFIDMVTHLNPLQSIMNTSRHIRHVYVYIVYENTGVLHLLLGRGDIGGRGTSGLFNVFGGELPSKNDSWNDLGHFIFDKLHEQLGFYPTAELLKNNVVHAYDDTTHMTTTELHMCFLVSGKSHDLVGYLDNYAHLKRKLSGVRKEFTENIKFMCPSIDDDTAIDKLAANRLVCKEARDFESELKKMLVTIDRSLAIPWDDAMVTKLNFKFNPLNDLTPAPSVPASGSS
jgi:hypothetical protein